ncbi:MAG: D-alanyl-D-alanine carboxypeptidase family protein [Frankiales bacterium]|nr:D-alanyl-D-alanine carboxypeptidase family protein [Frankiales bacterium]
MLPGPLPALLLGLAGGGLALAGLLPGAPLPAAGAEPPRPVLAVAAPARPVENLRRERATEVSRSRVALASIAPAPVAESPLPVPSPPVLPGCDGERADISRYANGRLPESVLCTVPGSDGKQLRADAAVAFVRLQTAYERDMGERMCVIDGYRPLAEQLVLRRTRGHFAAVPGTSEHGLGQAVDLGCGVQSFRTPQHAWMLANAGAYGWFHPDWAEPGGRLPEPWHWEYDSR